MKTTTDANRTSVFCCSNILLRLVKRDLPEYLLVRQAVECLRKQNIRLGYTHQNMAEFWNRPVGKMVLACPWRKPAEMLKKLQYIPQK